MRIDPRISGIITVGVAIVDFMIWGFVNKPFMCAVPIVCQVEGLNSTVSVCLASFYEVESCVYYEVISKCSYDIVITWTPVCFQKDISCTDFVKSYSLGFHFAGGFDTCSGVKMMDFIMRQLYIRGLVGWLIFAIIPAVVLPTVWIMTFCC